MMKFEFIDDGWRIIKTEDSFYRFIHLEKKLLTKGAFSLLELKKCSYPLKTEGEIYLQRRYKELIGDQLPKGQESCVFQENPG